MTSRILVTGAAGFIGATVVRALVGRGDRVAALDSGAAAGLASLQGVDAELFVGDIRDAGLVERAIAGCDAVVHLAAQAGVPASIADPLADHSVNVDGSLTVLEAARHTGAARFVFASSNAIAGAAAPPANEGTLPRPVSPYGAAKASIEAYLAAYRAAYGLETVALRFANSYGPWSAHKTSVVAAFVKAYLRGGPLVIRGSGRQTRDLVHVDDVTAAVLASVDAPPAAVSGQVFQVGTGIETSISSLAAALCAAGGAPVAIEHAPASPGDVERNVSDIALARRVLGYEPRVALADGLDRTLDWFRGNWTG